MRDVGGGNMIRITASIAAAFTLIAGAVVALVLFARTGRPVHQDHARHTKTSPLPLAANLIAKSLLALLLWLPVHEALAQSVRVHLQPHPSFRPDTTQVDIKREGGPTFGFALNAQYVIEKREVNVKNPTTNTIQKQLFFEPPDRHRYLFCGFRITDQDQFGSHWTLAYFDKNQVQLDYSIVGGLVGRTNFNTRLFMRVEIRWLRIPQQYEIGTTDAVQIWGCVRDGWSSPLLADNNPTPILVEPPPPPTTCHQLIVYPALQPGIVRKVICSANSASECQRARSGYGDISECKQVSSASEPPPVTPKPPPRDCYTLSSHTGPGSAGLDWGLFCGPNGKDDCFTAASAKNDEWKGLPGGPRYGCSRHG